MRVATSPAQLLALALREALESVTRAGGGAPAASGAPTGSTHAAGAPSSAPIAWRSRDAYERGPFVPPAAPADNPIGLLGTSPSLYQPTHPGGTARAEAAINALGPPPADHPMMKYAADVRARLAKEGLPTDASGVRVVVLGEDASSVMTPADHGNAVARSIAGPIGLGRGAAVELRDPLMMTLHRSPLPKAEAAERFSRGVQASMGTASMSDALRAGVDRLEDQIDHARAEVHELTATTKGARTTIATLSWGQSPTRVGLEIANAAIAQGNDAPMIREANALRAKAGVRTLDVTKEADAAAFRGDIITSLVRASTHGDGKQRLESAREALGREVAAARDKGILTFAAAGNEHASNALIPGADRSSIAGTPGLIMVGATDVGDPTKPGDDKVADFSNDGAIIAAPGARMPVTAPTGMVGPKPAPLDEDGTSFASPYAAGVAALMVKANPKITPDEIEAILKRTATNDASTTRDGAGVIDPVAAVRAAKALVPVREVGTWRRPQEP